MTFQEAWEPWFTNLHCKDTAVALKDIQLISGRKGRRIWVES